jgi:hypothetical protein
MKMVQANEDWRGVNIEQIDEMLNMSVPQRVEEMVRLANLIEEIHERVLNIKNPPL